MGSSLRFGLRFVSLAELPVPLRTAIQGLSQIEEGGMPFGQSIISQLIVAAIVAEVIEEPCLDPGCFGVGMAGVTFGIS